MLVKTRGIVLHAIPYNDTYSVIHIYTEAFGRASYLVARNRGKKSKISKALFMPLSVVEMEVEHQNKRDLHRIRETKICFPLSQLSCDPVKNVLALFLAEVLYRVVKETEPDTRLFDYIYRSVYILESADAGIANFHMVFLLHLLNYLGIFPNLDSYSDGSYFDMKNGTFITSLPMHRYYLDRAESKVFSRLFRISYENMSLYAFSRQERVNILERILAYYRLHLPEIPEIKSVAVLQTLFE